MIHKVAKFIQQKQLMQEGEKVLVALSGGADSVALLMILQKLGYECEAIHCNFHLRGEESMRDEEFVRSLCERKDTELFVVDFDTQKYAEKKGISIEMAARELRYNAFEQHRKKRGAKYIAVAHHRDDSAETMLLNLVRGTGIRGLHGIPPKNGNIVRPLLCLGREDIIEYLAWRGEEYVTDSTNLETDFTRNKIRLQILPLLQEINPSIAESLAHTARRIEEAEKLYTKAIEEGCERVKKGNIIDIALLKQEPSPQALLHEILRPLGFNSSQTDSITEALDAESGRTFESSSHRVIKDRSTLIITTKEEEQSTTATPLPESGSIETPCGTIMCETKIFDGKVEKTKEVATIDCDKVKLPLTLRTCRKGDRFAPFGMRGCSKLVSDYLTDCKKNIVEKQQQLLVADSAGTIVWLVGERGSASCAVDEGTKKILRIEWRRK
jgi:tRNA(Ile)-lysidine synthase